MWILPKNYQLSSRFALDMVESKEDLTLPGLNIESSLMWRSKPSQLRTWSTRWKQGSYLPHLFTRILKPSQRTSFETALTSSLEVIRASRFQQQDSEREPMTQDTFGHLYGDTSNQLDLLDASLKTSRDTSRLDSQQSSAIWKRMVTEQRGEYSQRVKSAHLIKENESTSWATPNTMDHFPQRSEEALIRQATTQRKGRTKPANLREQVNPIAVAIYQEPTNWPTVRVSSANGASQKELAAGNPKKRLEAEVLLNPWPTPAARDYKGASGWGRQERKGFPEDSLPNAVTNWPTPSAHEARLGYQDRSDPTKKGTQESLTTVIVNKAGGRSVCAGHLNPDWVEWLMGVPTGWTGLGCWETE